MLTMYDSLLFVVNICVFFLLILYTKSKDDCFNDKLLFINFSITQFLFIFLNFLHQLFLLDYMVDTLRVVYTALVTQIVLGVVMLVAFQYWGHVCKDTKCDTDVRFVKLFVLPSWLISFVVGSIVGILCRPSQTILTVCVLVFTYFALVGDLCKTCVEKSNTAGAMNRRAFEKAQVKEITKTVEEVL